MSRISFPRVEVLMYCLRTRHMNQGSLFPISSFTLNDRIALSFHGIKNGLHVCMFPRMCPSLVIHDTGNLNLFSLKPAILPSHEAHHFGTMAFRAGGPHLFSQRLRVFICL